ncbi:MAG: hypothetical protein QOE32_4721, partial [Pseudonocardiales bacterium]|nr:hypothetical protein [Pseudonocardiales bacterium]
TAAAGLSAEILLATTARMAWASFRAGSRDTNHTFG